MAFYGKSDAYGPKWDEKKAQKKTAQRNIYKNRINKALNHISEQRNKKSEMSENIARKGLGLVGGFIGGPIGAGIGNLAGGLLEDWTDTASERVMTQADFDNLNIGPEYFSEANDQWQKQNQKWKERNQMDNMRHFSEPIKAYGTAMTFAKLGTATESAGDVVGWEDMSYFDKASRSGLDMLKEEGGVKGVAKNMYDNTIGRLMSLGINEEAAIDPEIGNVNPQLDHATGESMATGESLFDDAEVYGPPPPPVNNNFDGHEAIDPSFINYNDLEPNELIDPNGVTYEVGYSDEEIMDLIDGDSSYEVADASMNLPSTDSWLEDTTVKNSQIELHKSSLGDTLDALQNKFGAWNPAMVNPITPTEADFNKLIRETGLTREELERLFMSKPKV